MGFIAHTCVEVTTCYAGGRLRGHGGEGRGPLIYSDEEMHAALDINIPNYASAIVTTNEAIDAIAGPKDLNLSAQS